MGGRLECSMNVTFPTGPRAAVTAGLQGYLERTYRLGPITATADLGGAYNLNALLSTPKGRFVARVYRPWVTSPRLEALQGLKHRLKVYHLPVVLPLPTSDGRTVASFGGRVLELEPFVPNDGAIESWERCEKAFSLLGKLHGAFSGVPTAAVPAPKVENYGSPETLIRWTKAAQRRIREMASLDAPQALALCDVSLLLLENLQSRWSEDAQYLPQGLVHGDFGIGNLLWRQNDIVAVGDFDFVAYHERIFDVAYALFWTFERLEPTRDYALWSWDRIPELLEHYDVTNSRPLTLQERKALPFEMARVPLYWPAEAVFLPDPIRAVLSCADMVRTASWLLEHAQELAHKFAP